MPTHGTKRNTGVQEEIFHVNYGWVSATEFFDLPEMSIVDEEDILIEPDFLQRQSGESSEHFKHKIRDVNDLKDETLGD